jgi:cell fate regulator YaaT (PSP1 superfamily)
MPRVMAVSFNRYGRLYYLDAADYPGTVSVGDKVLVPTDEGTEVAECVWAPQWVTDDIGGLPSLAGLASDADIERDEHNRRRVAQTKVAVKRLVREHGLPMKPVAIDVRDRADPPRVVVYFSAPQRVDFRALLRDLYQAIDGKIELRQVGARDAAKVQGGIGPCGRDLCCATFLTDFEPVSVRMAKDQDLPVNPLKISGACGRLMCCLKYEHPLYQEFKAQAPAVGATVETPEGEGRVIAHEVPLTYALRGGRTTTAIARAGLPHRGTRHPTSDPVAAGRCRAAGRWMFRWLFRRGCGIDHARDLDPEPIRRASGTCPLLRPAPGLEQLRDQLPVLDAHRAGRLQPAQRRDDRHRGDPQARHRLRSRLAHHQSRWPR